MNRRAVLAVALSLGVSSMVHGQTAPRSQQRLEREVRHELVMLPYYGVFDNLMFRVENYRVTLMGVESVDNQIEVRPLSPNDDRIRLAVYRAIYRQASLSRYALQAVPPIHIIVKNGNVRLEGVVATEADKNLAGMRAKGVSGVFSVNNDLRVEKPQS